MARSSTFIRAAGELTAARAALGATNHEERDGALALVDAKLDAFLAARAPDARAFADKMRALEREYGCDWQPRHVTALLADTAVLGAA